MGRYEWAQEWSCRFGRAICAFTATEARAMECRNHKRRPSMVVRQLCNVFVSHWVSRHARIVRWKCALVWVARSCLAVVHMRRVWATRSWCTGVPVAGVVVGASPGGGLKWSGCSVRIWLWLRMPHSCHRHLSNLPMFGGASARGLFSSSYLVPVSARCIRFLGSTGLCVHPGQRSLPSRGAAVAGPIRPH